MLLCKVMLNLVCLDGILFPIMTIADRFRSARQPEDVTSLLSIKLASKYAQLRDVESMRAIARAHQKRNLADFEKALKDYQQGAAVESYVSRAPPLYADAFRSTRAIVRHHDPDASLRVVRHAA